MAQSQINCYNVFFNILSRFKVQFCFTLLMVKQVYQGLLVPQTNSVCLEIKNDNRTVGDHDVNLPEDVNS